MKKITMLLTIIISVLSADTYYYSFGKKIHVRKLSESRSADTAEIDYYQTEYDHKVGVKNEVIIGCEKGIDCTKILVKYDILNIEQLSPTLYLLKLPKNTNPFEISNQLYGEKEIKLAHPNFIQKRQKR